MGKLVSGMMQSLDGYVGGVAGGPELPPPGVALHRHFTDQVRGLAGGLYGRRMYEIMRYWFETEQMPYARFIGRDGLHMNDFGYTCIGRLLALAVVRSLDD